MRPDKVFTEYACTSLVSKVWIKLFKKDPPWKSECIKHHIHYWVGGSCRDRWTADVLLFRGLRKSGHPICAFVAFLLMRFGGVKEWGSGYSYPKHKYYDRTRTQHMVLQEQCLRLNIQPKEMYGVT